MRVIGSTAEAIPAWHSSKEQPRLTIGLHSSDLNATDFCLQVVSHPFVIPWLAPEDVTAAERANASSKIGVLEQLLRKLRAAEHCVLLLSQDPAVSDLPLLFT